MKIQTNGELNDLFNKFLEQDTKTNDSYLLELMDLADYALVETYGEYDIPDLKEYIDIGIELEIKSHKTKKPIFAIQNEYNDMTLYFVNDLISIKQIFEKFINEQNLEIEAELKIKEEQEIKTLEEKLALLKKDKRKNHGTKNK